MKKISVIGAGAIGAMFGGLIKRHNPNLEVVMIARGDHLAAMQDRGTVELRGDWGKYDVPVTASSEPSAITGSDLVLFTVKTQDTAATAERFAESIGDAVVVSLQNGINQRILSKFLRPDRLLVGMTATNMGIIAPGVIDCTRRGVSVIGAASADVPAEIVDHAAQTLSSSGLPVEASDSILGVQYNKLLFNTMGYASVLSATDFLRDGIFNRTWRTSVAMPILDEGFRVLEAAGIPLQKASGGSDVIRLRRLMRMLAVPGLDNVVRMIARGPLAPPRLVFSVYQDLLRGRPTEIEFVNGEIARLANECGVNAPYNAEVVRMVHEMERSTEKKFMSREEVAEHFRSLRRD
ncbi:ketopantoate reductase family protein [Aporhodopirellula aestuarii]|uniref:2-dehydropantoate 2-reductase n=1 Tax=Aporhodopirellula aestuarii TaxID=2950107 RepID=A0ABT0TX47_9BACT|nr:2-dehydropantoate 2-reductase [Aporhodopirellula aestuarii]MCM2369155.1 2-dehydropantoate 2-reductase [Aporhodopirellula aestuarii]